MLPSWDWLVLFADNQHVATIPVHLQLISFKCQARSSTIRLVKVHSLCTTWQTKRLSQPKRLKELKVVTVIHHVIHHLYSYS